ncbi:MAG: hypothetical protein ACREFH_15220, partial [Stellaceae bacterium]
MPPAFANMRRLDVRGPTSRRVVVDVESAMLGPDCVLVRPTSAGYRALGREEAAAIQELLSGTGDTPDRLFRICGGIAKALDEGQLALAQIAGLRIPVFELDSRQLKELAAAAPLIKANFNPDEPRDEHGRWTHAGGGDSEAAPAVAAIGTTAAAAVEAGASIFGTLGRAALASLADFAAGFAAPTAFFGVLFLPTNRSLVSEGTLPGRPDLAYRYDRDTGILDIYREGEGGRHWLDSGHIGADGRFYDAGRRVVGRSLGQTIAVDPDALPAPLGHARADAGALSASNRPQLCPDESPENINGRSERSLAYQEQISGLPRGFEIVLNGVRFDGCRETNGTMLEAKG